MFSLGQRYVSIKLYIMYYQIVLLNKIFKTCKNLVYSLLSVHDKI